MDTQHIDLLQLIGRDIPLKRQGSTDGGEYAGPCPSCGGRDRFRVWPNKAKPNFWCRGCGLTGDAIDYVRQRDNLDFKAASTILQLDTQFNLRKTRQSSQQHSTPVSGAPKDLNLDCPVFQDAGWQVAAQVFSTHAVKALKSLEGQAARAYLMARGLSDQVITAAGLGFNPHGQHQQWGREKVWLQAGIVIPWQIGDRLWRVKIRSLESNPKHRYGQAAGGANGLYGSDAIPYKGTVLVTEGEFDALVARTQLDAVLPNFAAVATGSTAGARVIPWVIQLKLASKVWLAFDTDPAGDEAAAWWADQLGNKAIRLRPTQHDITDMAVVGEDLLAWVRAYV